LISDVEIDRFNSQVRLANQYVAPMHTTFTAGAVTHLDSADPQAFATPLVKAA